jgi:hypothetical protein
MFFSKIPFFSYPKHCFFPTLISFEHIPIFHCIFPVFFASNIWFSLPIIPYIRISSMYIFRIFGIKHMVFLTNNPIVSASFFKILNNIKFYNSCQCCLSHHVQIVLFLWQCLVHNLPAFLQEHVVDFLQSVLHLHLVFFPPMGRYLL